MDATAANEIMEYLNGVAETVIVKDVKVLKEMKSGLDDYVDSVTSKIPGPSKVAANEEFEKCRVCAREWITVFCDSTYHPGDKADILREEAVEFFFAMDERIRAVQKKFFLLGMIDEILKPGAPFTVNKREAKIANAKIKIMAREQGLKASCKNNLETVTGEAREGRLWYFGDDRNFLQSDDAGLTDEEAIEYLLR